MNKTAIKSILGAALVFCVYVQTERHIEKVKEMAYQNGLLDACFINAMKKYKSMVH